VKALFLWCASSPNPSKKRADWIPCVQNHVVTMASQATGSVQAINSVPKISSLSELRMVLRQYNCGCIEGMGLLIDSNQQTRLPVVRDACMRTPGEAPIPRVNVMSFSQIINEIVENMQSSLVTSLRLTNGSLEERLQQPIRRREIQIGPARAASCDSGGTS